MIATLSRNRLLIRKLRERVERVVVARRPHSVLLAKWRSFELALGAHMAAEEKVIVPRLLGTRARDAHALLAEHRHLRQRLAALRASFELGMGSAPAVRSFGDELEAHEDHEHRTLAAWAESDLSAEDRVSVASSLRERRSR